MTFRYEPTSAERQQLARRVKEIISDVSDENFGDWEYRLQQEFPAFDGYVVWMTLAANYAAAQGIKDFCLG